MFYEALSVAFSFEDGATRERLIKMYNEMGAYEFGRYISDLVERDFYDKVIEQRIQSKSTVQDSVDMKELLEKVNKLLEGGFVPVQSSAPSSRVTSPGDLSVLNKVKDEIKQESQTSTPVTVPKVNNKKKKGLAGLKQGDLNSILNKMNSMTK